MKSLASRPLTTCQPVITAQTAHPTTANDGDDGDDDDNDDDDDNNGAVG